MNAAAYGTIVLPIAPGNTSVVPIDLVRNGSGIVLSVGGMIVKNGLEYPFQFRKRFRSSAKMVAARALPRFSRWTSESTFLPNVPSRMVT